MSGARGQPPVVAPVSEVKVINLERKKAVFKEYLLAKVQEEDWHGVSDVANDLRELEVELEMRRN